MEVIGLRKEEFIFFSIKKEERLQRSTMRTSGGGAIFSVSPGQPNPLPNKGSIRMNSHTPRHLGIEKEHVGVFFLATPWYRSI